MASDGITGGGSVGVNPGFASSSINDSGNSTGDNLVASNKKFTPDWFAKAVKAIGNPMGIGVSDQSGAYRA